MDLNMMFLRLIRASVLLVALFQIAACTTNPTAGSSKTADGEDPNYDKAGKAKAIKVTQTARGVQLSSDERVLFEVGKSEVKPEGMVYVERIATILKTKTQANVAIEGHTDNQGTAVLNQQLSVRRANAVKEALVKQGVAAVRIQAQGLGMTKPIADNGTTEGRQANRRTDLTVLGEVEANISGPPGSPGLADQLSAGLDKFLKSAGDFLKNVFGGSAKE
jgi:outer membrane protein OmpA-like peptidoglycan-associated protein